MIDWNAEDLHVECFAFVQVLAAVLRFANEQTKESVRKELLTVMKDRSTIEAWGDNVLGGRAEKPVQQQKKKSKKKK